MPGDDLVVWSGDAVVVGGAGVGAPVAAVVHGVGVPLDG